MKRIKVLLILIFTFVVITIISTPFFYKGNSILSFVYADKKDSKIEFKTEEKNVFVENDQEAIKSALLVQRAISNVAKSVYNSVVNIRSKILIKNNVKNPFEDFFDFFDKPFRNHPRKPRSSETLGSGFIISKTGYIITNNHVISNSKKVKVLLHDQSEYEAKVIGTDKKSDIAVIKIIPKDEDKLVPIPLGNSETVNIGDFSIAIGNPFGIFSGTFTLGIISAKGRSNLNVLDEDSGYKNYIQTDAPINRGNSGGPLLNIRGQVIGMNTAMYSTQAGSYLGIGFAIPINIIKIVSKDLITSGVVKRGVLGISVSDINDDFAKYYKLKSKNGCFVNQIHKGSAAEKAGIKEQDIIISLEGKNIKNCDHLRANILYNEVGKEYKITILRTSNKNKQLTLKISPQHEVISANEEKSETTTSKGDELDFFGVHVVDIKDYINEKMNTQYKNLYKKLSKGVVVSFIDHSIASKYLRPGDILQSVNSIPISNMNDLKKIIKKNSNLDSFLLKLKRINLKNNSFNVFYFVLKNAKEDD